MSRSLNKVNLIGNVGQDPEVRTTAGGTKMAKVSLATSYGTGDKERTQWHRLTFWSALAEIVERHVHKGDRLFVEGRIEYSQSEDDQGGTRYWTDIVAQEMILLGGGAGEREAAPARTGRSTPNPFDDDDDLPFSGRPV